VVKPEKKTVTSLYCIGDVIKEKRLLTNHLYSCYLHFAEQPTD